MEVMVFSLITDTEYITVVISTFKTKKLFEQKSFGELGLLSYKWGAYLLNLLKIMEE